MCRVRYTQGVTISACVCNYVCMDRTEQMVILSGAAADQWGLVTAAQAKKLGLNAVQLMRLAEAGLLENVGRGVYAMPAAGLPQYLEMKVAWLRLQPEAFAWERALGDRDSGVVSHASACQLHGLGDVPAPDVEISVPRRRTTTEPFVRLCTAQLESVDITVVDGLPVTTAARTVVDLLRARTDGGHVGGVIADAERRGLVDIDDLADHAQPFVRTYGLPLTASGRELIERLVKQAGRRLHSQELVQAGQEGFEAAARALTAHDHGGLMAAPYFRNRAAEGNAVVAALGEDVMSQPVASDAVQQAVRRLQQSPAWLELLREIAAYPGLVRGHPYEALMATAPEAQRAAVVAPTGRTATPNRPR